MKSWARSLVTSVAVLAGLAAACGGGKQVVEYPLDRSLRLNQVQVLASHNSYHLESDSQLPSFIKDPLRYSHARLDRQLEQQGIRGFEIDVVNAPSGFPVVHLPVIDNKSNCSPLGECLRVVKRWSKAHPRHVPIFILIETKDGMLERTLDPTLGLFDSTALDRLDRQVRSALGKQLITPDEVRGRSKTLRDAVLRRGWPALSKTRGKVMVIINDDGAIREQFLIGHPSLQRRAMFVTADPGAPSAAVIKVDDPHEGIIRELVAQGFIVRTRSDADLVEARNRDTTRREIALRSGAQMVSTDFEVPDPPVGGPYVVRIPDGTPARCNPVHAPKRCHSRDVENPRHLRR